MDEEVDTLPDWEVSAVNTFVRRRSGGIWGVDVLPIVEWEEPRHRKVLPPSVQDWMEIRVPVIRVSKDIVRKQYEKHSDVVRMYEAFDLATWAYVRVVVDWRGRKWEFVQLIEGESDEPWPLMTVLGEDASGNVNLVSMHRRNRRWMSRLLRGEMGFQERER